MKKLVLIIFIISLFISSVVFASRNNDNEVNNSEIVELVDIETSVIEEVGSKENDNIIIQDEEYELIETKYSEEKEDIEDEIINIKKIYDIATNSELYKDEEEFYGANDDDSLDTAKWQGVENVMSVSYLIFERDDNLNINENLQNFINECQLFLDTEDNEENNLSIDGFLFNTKYHEFFMYEYNGLIVKRTAVNKTKDVLNSIKDASTVEECLNLTDENSEYYQSIYNMYVEANNAYMIDYRDKNTIQLDQDYRESLITRGYSVLEFDDKDVVFDSSDTNKAYTAFCTVEKLSDIMSNSELKIESNLAKLIISQNALKNILSAKELDSTSNYNGSDKIYFKIVALEPEYVDGNDEINENQRRLVRSMNKGVVDFMITNAKGDPISLNNAEVEISIPYNLDDGEENLSTIWYINDNGKVEYHSAKYTDGWLTFKTNHFSPYFQYKGKKKNKTKWDE